MRFRGRKYDEEEGASPLRRQTAQQHPLSSSSVVRPQTTSPLQVSLTDQCMGDSPPDPLRAVSVQKSLLSALPSVAVEERSSRQAKSKGKLDDQVEASSTGWEAHRTSILQRFTSNDTIKVSATLDVISRHLKGRGRSLTAAHLDELDDSRREANEALETISQEEYVVRLRELNDNIANAWMNNERVATLRLAVKVAKLLMDTSAPKFYPTLFILVTDALETIGNLVWERIKGKAEVDDNGNNIKILPESFTADDVRQEAKDTCKNWFYKIGSIYELLPRIYLEIAILRCMQFLQNSSPVASLQRLNIMIRGLADPLAGAYARLYLARKGQSIIPYETGYLIMGLDDYLLLYRRVLSGNFERVIFRSGLDKPTYASLVEPFFELYLQYICACATKEELLFIVKTFCEQQSSSDFDGERSAPASVLVHYLLKQLPAVVVSANVLYLSKIVERSVDVSKPQYLNYRLLGTKLCESNPPTELRLTVLLDIWKAVSQICDLVEYLTVADVLVDYILDCCSEAELSVLLCNIVKRFPKTNSSEDALRILESIVVKVMEKITDIKRLITMHYFGDILDKFHGDSRFSVQKQILLYVIRNGQILGDPVTRQFSFELCKSLYKSLDSMSGEDEQRQIARIISRFIHLVDFEEDLEQHLSFLADCRGTFATMDSLRETVVHASNRLAITAVKITRGRLTWHTVDFVKACITFNEISIPCMQDVAKRILLYIETAEVAMMSGLVSHSESVLKSSIKCLQEFEDIPGRTSVKRETELLNCIRKLCSLLIIVPGHPELGTFYLLRGLLHAINTELRLKEPLKVQALLGVILACNALSQDKLPYHVASREMNSNDELFGGELSYQEELVHLTVGVVESIRTSVNDIAGKGKEVLFACEVFAIAFELGDSDDLYQPFAILAKAAQPLLPQYTKASTFVDYFTNDVA